MKHDLRHYVWRATHRITCLIGHKPGGWYLDIDDALDGWDTPGRIWRDHLHGRVWPFMCKFGVHCLGYSTRKVPEWGGLWARDVITKDGQQPQQQWVGTCSYCGKVLDPPQNSPPDESVLTVLPPSAFDLAMAGIYDAGTEK